MVEIEEIIEATRVIRDIQQDKGRRGARIHHECLEDNMHRLRALEGACGHCANLQIEIRFFDGRKRALLSCERWLSPLRLYRETPQGQKAQCPSHTLREVFHPKPNHPTDVYPTPTIDLIEF